MAQKWHCRVLFKPGDFCSVYSGELLERLKAMKDGDVLSIRDGQVVYRWIGGTIDLYFIDLFGEQDLPNPLKRVPMEVRWGNVSADQGSYRLDAQLNSGESGSLRLKVKADKGTLGLREFAEMLLAFTDQVAPK